jgi:hypothetical protein
VFEIAVSPHPDGVAITPELGGDLEVGGLILVVGPEDQAATKDEGLRRGTGPHQGFQAGSLGIGQVDTLRER